MIATTISCCVLAIFSCFLFLTLSFLHAVPWDPLSSPTPSIRSTFASSLAADADLLSHFERDIQELQYHQEHTSIAQQSQFTDLPSKSTLLMEEAREVSGRCWMATDFPFSLRQLLPLLEAAGAANKHLSAAASFLSMYRDQSLFPIRLKIPLMWTVYLMLRFREYQRVSEATKNEMEESEFFEIPKEYSKNSVIAEMEETFYEI